MDEFNKQADFDIERIRDFIILHYKVTNRTDTDFWRHCRSMEIPDSLAHRMDIFRETGHVFRDAAELFDDSWQQVMIGQGLIPERYHALVDTMSEKELADFLAHVKDERGSDPPGTCRTTCNTWTSFLQSSQGQSPGPLANLGSGRRGKRSTSSSFPNRLASIQPRSLWSPAACSEPTKCSRNSLSVVVAVGHHEPHHLARGQ